MDEPGKRITFKHYRRFGFWAPKNMASFFLYIWEHLRIAIEIGVLWFLIYSILLFLKGTRAAPVLAGIVVVAFILYLLSWLLGLEVIDWLLLKILAVLATAVVIIFQPEIRRALAEIGSQSRVQGTFKTEKEMIELLLNAVFYLADRRLGALVVIQQDIGMRAIAETGTAINAPLSEELLTTFFFPNTPLHDGGVLIKGDRILAAGCILPLTQDPDMAKSLGTRHRAAVGVTEETDAVVVIVSEETGAVSLAHKGRMVRGLNRQRLERHLTNLLIKSRQAATTGRTLENWVSHLKATFVGPISSPEDESSEI